MNWIYPIYPATGNSTFTIADPGAGTVGNQIPIGGNTITIGDPGHFGGVNSWTIGTKTPKYGPLSGVSGIELMKEDKKHPLVLDYDTLEKLFKRVDDLEAENKQLKMEFRAIKDHLAQRSTSLQELEHVAIEIVKP